MNNFHYITSPSRLPRRQMETKMADALRGFEKYFDSLATGKLDGYLDSTQPEDKVTDLGVVLHRHPILLTHELGKHPDQERIEELFHCDKYNRCDIVFVVPG